MTATSEDLVFALLGPDRPGIVKEISALVREHGGTGSSRASRISPDTLPASFSDCLSGASRRAARCSLRP